MKQNILLVEDEKKIADTIQSGLGEYDYNVVTAYNGLEGKDLYYAGKYDLVIDAADDVIETVKENGGTVAIL